MILVPLEKRAVEAVEGSGLLRVVSDRALYVYDSGTTDEATGYADAAGTTPLTYPITPETDGSYAAWFPPGMYDLFDPQDNDSQPWVAGTGAVGIEIDSAELTSATNLTPGAFVTVDIPGLTVDVPAGTRPVMLKLFLPGIQANAVDGATFRVFDGAEHHNLGILSFPNANRPVPVALERRLPAPATAKSYQARIMATGNAQFAIYAGPANADNDYVPAFLQAVQV